MSTIQVDENNNILLIKGNITTIEGIEELKQNIINALSICYGENPFDTEQGIDYDNQVLGKLGGIDFIKNSIKNELYKIPEITSVQEIIINNDNGILNIKVFINSIYGNIQL